jgi:hypothetical protein
MAISLRLSRSMRRARPGFARRRNFKPQFCATDGGLAMSGMRMPRGLMRRGERGLYSITSSARSRNDSGIVKPIAWAAFRFTINLNVNGACTGRSFGAAPLRILSA